MTTALKVLIVENSPDDALLMIRELKRGDYEADVTRVETAAQFRQALEDGTWDVILSDYALPGFDAPAALKIKQEYELDIPFIIVSGTIGEDLAVAAMKAGAQDYFSKDKITRLVPAIERELRDAKDRRQRLQAEERFAMAFRASPVAMTITAEDTRFMDVNDSAVRLMGYERSELIGQLASELNIWIDWEDPRRIVQMLEEGIEVHDVETRIRRKDGALRDIIFSLETFSIGDEGFILSMTRDITEHKRVQADLLLRNRALEATPVGAIITDPHQPDDPIIYANPAFETITGYAASEILGKNCRFLQANDQNQPELDTLRAALRENRECVVTLRNYRKDGTLFWNNLRIAPIFDRVGPVDLSRRYSERCHGAKGR